MTINGYGRKVELALMKDTAIGERINALSAKSISWKMECGARFLGHPEQHEPFLAKVRNDDVPAPLKFSVVFVPPDLVQRIDDIVKGAFSHFRKVFY